MVMFVPGLSNKFTSPGSPAPITFGMASGAGPSLSLSPGGGEMGEFGPPPGSYGSSSYNAPSNGQAAQVNPSPSSQQATNLAPVNVSAQSPIGGPTFGGLYGGGSGSGSGIDIPAPNTAITVQNMAPVKVTPQMPVQPSWLDSLWMMGNDHPVMSNIIKSVVGGVTGLSPVIVAANAYENAKHGQPLFGGGLGAIGSGLSGLFDGGGGPGGPLSTNANNPLYANLYQQQGAGQAPSQDSGSVGIGSGGPTIASSGALPAYPGLSSLGAGSAPIGGYWNQQALRDAAPAYGPYAGFGISNFSPAAQGGAFAPYGITGH